MSGGEIIKNKGIENAETKKFSILDLIKRSVFYYD